MVFVQRTSKGVKGWGDEVEVTFTNHFSALVIHIRFTYGSFSLTWSADMQISCNKGNFFTREKISIPNATFFKIFFVPQSGRRDVICLESVLSSSKTSEVIRRV